VIASCARLPAASAAAASGTGLVDAQAFTGRKASLTGGLEPAAVWADQALKANPR
jgi:hypothetical protein